MRIIFILVILFLGCSNEKPITKEEPFNGWAGSPDNPQIRPFDYFYMKNRGHASSRFIKKRNKFMIEWTCKESATSIVKTDLALGIVFRSGIDDCHRCGCFGCTRNYSEESLNFVSFVDLVACPHDYPIDPTLSALFSKVKEKVKVEVTDCKPIAIPDPNIERSEWKECECTVYAHTPNGRKSIREQCIELEKKFEDKR